MTDQSYTIKSVAPLRNVSNLLALVHRVQDRPMSLPGMATFHGPSGYGKSFALIYVGNATGAIAVECKSYWTRPTPLCKAILFELGVTPARTVSEMAEQITNALARSGVPLIIDEADHLMKTSMIELVRDFYEGSGVPVILIGEEKMPQKLKKWDRIHNRMLAWVEATPSDEEDARHLARIYADGVEVADDLIARIVRVSDGNTRRISTNLNAVREFAAERGLDRVDASLWGQRTFFDGEAPEPRIRMLGGAR